MIYQTVKKSRANSVLGISLKMGHEESMMPGYGGVSNVRVDT
jgi:hypothetical protein